MLILTLGMVKSSLATETKDMIPPEGNITITNSTITEGINYVDNLDVTLKISATDNVTTSANLKMYITTTPNANQIEILMKTGRHIQLAKNYIAGNKRKY